MKKTSYLEKRERVVTFLNRREVDFLDKMGKDALFSSGAKLSRAKILSWSIDFLKKLNLSGKNIKTEDDFEKKVREVWGQNTMGVSPTSHGRETK
jgi:hypothetical protein